MSVGLKKDTQLQDLCVVLLIKTDKSCECRSGEVAEVRERGLFHSPETVPHSFVSVSLRREDACASKEEWADLKPGSFHGPLPVINL